MTANCRFLGYLPNQSLRISWLRNNKYWLKVASKYEMQGTIMEKCEADVKVDVVRLDSDMLNEHLRSSTAVLQDILKDAQPADGLNECQDCGKVYKNSTTLLKHSQLKHPKHKIQVQCVSCDKKYSSVLSLQKHIRYMHRYEHRCKACYRSFATADILSNHSEMCSKNEQPCPACDKVFASDLALRNHTKYKHPQVKNNWCEICRRTFITKRGLANHMATIHPPGTVCSWCNKDFNSVIALQSHILYKHTSNGSRCFVCRKVFTSQASLTRHVLKNHADKPQSQNYMCGVCLESFGGSSQLTSHVLDNHPTSDTADVGE